MAGKEITAAMVKALRDKTGAGMMDCKKALQESGGQEEAAVQWLREKGMAQAAKRAGRVAAEGRVAARVSGDGRVGAVVELNCETDFVARNEEFGGFVDTLLEHVLGKEPGGHDAFGASTLESTGKSVEESTTELSGKIGEKIVPRRYARLQAGTGCVLGSYVHPGDRIAVIVELQGADGAAAGKLETILKDVAMQVASMRPQFATEAEVDQAWLEKERQIALSQARESGKPENVVEKIAEGKVKASLKEACLVDQIFVKAAKKESVGQYIAAAGKDAGASQLAVSRFVRFELGEGVEKGEGS